MAVLRTAGYKTISPFFFSKTVLFFNHWEDELFCNLSITQKINLPIIQNEQVVLNGGPSDRRIQNNLSLFLFQNGFIFQSLRGGHQIIELQLIYSFEFTFKPLWKIQEK